MSSMNVIIVSFFEINITFLDLEVDRSERCKIVLLQIEFTKRL